MDVCLIGLHVDGTELCDHVWLDTAMARAVRVAQQRIDRFADHGATNIVTARAELDEDDGAHDPQVFIVDLERIGADDRTLVDELVQLPCGWIKTVGQGRKVRYIGNDRNRAWFKMEAAVYNLIRLTVLDAATA